MPVLADGERKKRPVPLWLLIFVAVLPLAGIFTWSLFQPVRLTYEGKGVAFGRTEYEPPPPGTVSHAVWRALKLPGGRRTGWYIAAAVWR